MKNPFLSAWLSGANTVLGAMRSLGASELGRQRARMLRAMSPAKAAKPRPKRGRTGGKR